MGDKELEELQNIRKLLLLLLYKLGADQGEVATALGLDQSTVSRMVPRGKIKAAWVKCLDKK